jgi:hypothetical protein
MAVSETDFPFTGPYSVEGNGVHKGPTAVALKRALSRLGYLPWEPDKWDTMFNKKLERALDEWDPGKDGYATGRWEKIRAAVVQTGSHKGEPALDAVCLDLVQGEADTTSFWSGLGPVFDGGKTVLQHDCTHATSGIPLYPAFDDAFSQGTVIIAPEEITVTRASSSNPGAAFYADGLTSGIRYWFGHLDTVPIPGTTIRQGYSVGKVCANNVGGGPHVHLGINVERLWGTGQQLEHKTNYTHGAKLIGDQLAEHDL